MIAAPFPKNETQRLEALLRYEVLDSEAEQAFDELTQLASAICGTSISLISLVDTNRQWFKSKVGLDADETSREVAFCSHAILQEGILEVPNAKEDERFNDNPLVSGAPDIRFYAGAPLVTPHGQAIGTLCVIDTEPKQLNASQRKALTTLAHQVISQLEVRLTNRQLQRMQKDQERFFAAMAHDLRSPFNGILGLSKMLVKKSDSISAEQLSVASNAILDSSLKVYQLLDESLQWARNQLGATQIELETLAIEEALDSSLGLLADAFELKEVSIEKVIESGLLVHGDKELCKIILRNLLANAMKYTPENSKVTIEASSHGDKVHVSVIDQGPGVPEDIKNTLFKECVDSTAGSHGELGQGLGLMLCADFAKKQGGQLMLDETYTDGSKLTLVLNQV